MVNFKRREKVKIKKLKKLSSLNLSKHIARLASKKKAEDILILDVKKFSNFCDYFVIMSALVDVHIKSLVEHIVDKVKKDFGRNPHHIEGENSKRWVIIDYIDVVVHIMTKDARDFYSLERVWYKGKPVKYEEKIKKNI
ncbi:MAG: ribosome silencing factor [Endomicrobia bacterium]|nr:ribosome silencing factor [Endomicrobiia bacterium]